MNNQAYLDMVRDSKYAFGDALVPSIQEAASALYQIGQASGISSSDFGAALQAPFGKIIGPHIEIISNTCHQCGRDITADMIECPGCGAGLGGKECPSCGRRHPASTNVCWNGWAGCGADLSNTDGTKIPESNIIEYHLTRSVTDGISETIAVIDEDGDIWIDDTFFNTGNLVDTTPKLCYNEH